MTGDVVTGPTAPPPITDRLTTETLTGEPLTAGPRDAGPLTAGPLTAEPRDARPLDAEPFIACSAAPRDPAAAEEDARLRVLASFEVLDTPREDAFDELTQLAARLCSASIALVSLVDADRQWFKSTVGTDLVETPREMSFCAHALHRQTVLHVPDARLDPRFRDLAPVTGPPGIRFYAGAPLVTSDGYTLGTLCVLATEPRTLTPDQERDLMVLARQVVRELELRRQASRLAVEVTTGVALRAELQDRQRLLDGILSHTDVRVFARDLEGRYLMANAAAERTLTAGDPAGPQRETPPVGDRATAAPAGEAPVVGPSEAFDEELLHADGTVHSYRSTTFPLLDGDGRQYGTAGVSTDFTELSAARTHLQESEERWRALVEHSPSAVAVIGSDGCFQYANQQAISLYGADTADQLLGRLAGDFSPRGNRSGVLSTFRDLLAGGTPVVAYRAVLCPLRGGRRTVEVNAVAVTDKGEPAVQVELRDVTELVTAEEVLAASEHRFRSVFDDSPVAMALSDSAGRWVEVNAAFGRLYGIDPVEAIGLTPGEFAHPDDRALIEATERERFASPTGKFELELRVLRADGAVRWVLAHLAHTTGPGGEKYALAILQDVTDRKAAEIALQESESDLATVAAVARCVQSGEDPRPIVVAAVRSLAGAASVSLLEADGDGALVATACDGVDLVGARLPLDEPSMSAHVWDTGEAVFLADVASDPRVNMTLIARAGTVSALWQPVVVAGQVQAMINVTWQQRVADPGERAVRAVRVVADEAGTSLQAARLRRELEQSASTDPLTGSFNRRAWDAHLLRLLESARVTGSPLTVAIADLDHFKAYNDQFGHSAGDDLLREFASAARGCLRKDDVFARWGGEEFILALADTPPNIAKIVLDRVRLSVPAGSSCSIGHTIWDPTEPVTDCIARADAALYEAKEAGRNQLATR